MNSVSIVGPLLSLRELREDDTDPLLAIYGSKVATEHMSSGPQTREQVAGVVSDAIECATAEPRVVYGLALTPTGSTELIGYAHLAVEARRAGQIWFLLNPAHWRQGYGTETVRMLLRFGFHDLGLQRMWGARSPENIGSAAVMLSQRMIEEGCIRDHVLTHGAGRGSVTHSILESEWNMPPF